MFKKRDEDVLYLSLLDEQKVENFTLLDLVVSKLGLKEAEVEDVCDAVKLWSENLVLRVESGRPIPEFRCDFEAPEHCICDKTLQL